MAQGMFVWVLIRLASKPACRLLTTVKSVIPSISSTGSSTSSITALSALILGSVAVVVFWGGLCAGNGVRPASSTLTSLVVTVIALFSIAYECTWAAFRGGLS